MSGPDHTYALEPAELKEMIRQIRWAEKSFGNGIKKPHILEKELSEYRRGIFTLRAIHPGERLDAENVAVLRRSGLPETDLEPKHWQKLMGKKASRSLAAYSLLSSRDIKN
jgi:N,N'-diacetyllegionaminate synthase